MKNYLENRLRYLSHKHNNAQKSLFQLEKGLITIPIVALLLSIRAGLTLSQMINFLVENGWILIMYSYFYIAGILYFQHRTQEYDAMCKVTLNYLCKLEDPRYKDRLELRCEDEAEKMKSRGLSF